MCADRWAGWDDAAASAACRMAGYAAGGVAVKVWRAGAPPPLLLGRLSCEYRVCASVVPRAAAVSIKTLRGCQGTLTLPPLWTGAVLGSQRRPIAVAGIRGAF